MFQTQSNEEDESFEKEKTFLNNQFFPEK